MSTEQVRDMRRTFNLFDKALDGYRHLLVVPRSIRDEAATHAVRYHLAHLRMFNIEQTEVDPYKAATWYGYFIWEHTRDKGRVPLVVTIHILNHLLRKEPKKIALDDFVIKQIVAFAKNHEGPAPIGTEPDGTEDKCCKHRDGNEDHAIGKIGIYTAFTVARRVLELYNPHRD